MNPPAELPPRLQRQKNPEAVSDHRMLQNNLLPSGPAFRPFAVSHNILDLLQIQPYLLLDEQIVIKSHIPVQDRHNACKLRAMGHR